MLTVAALSNAIYTLWNQIVYAVSNMNIPFDIIDILIIAFIIYKAIGFMRETRSGQLIKGLIILVVLYLLANWLNLASIKWLLTKVVDSAIIALAIIFQPELRRILERVGRTKLANGYSGDAGEELSVCIDNVSRAAGSMQETKTGALIVFERTTQLGEIINTGTIVDAKASSSVIKNIFFPKSPLHDGAMIIRDGRIYAAGCILPLTQRDDISASLGTRHRAAIGMTENSDAIVLVVSEETGNISLVTNGELKTDYNAVSAGAELRRLLLTGTSDSNNSSFKDFVKKLNPFKGKADRKEGE